MGDGEVRLMGRLICASDAEVEIVRRHLSEHVRLTLAEPGCLSFRVEVSDDPRVWHVEETFVDRAAFALHQNRAQASDWGRATVGIGREYQVNGLE